MTDLETGAESTVLVGRSALITGASGGLGSAIALELARHGATLTLVARDEKRLAAVPVQGHRLALDLRNPDSCALAINTAFEMTGRLDIVVNAVGVVAFGDIATLAFDVVEELFMANTFIPIALATAALGVMNQAGVFVNISGVIAERNLAGMAAYGSSKAGARAFNEGFAREARRRSLRVIDARPPHTETGLTGRAIAGVAPNLPVGLAPSTVARVIVDAILADTTDLPSTAFAPG